MRAQITGVQTGQDVTVWFTGGGKTTTPFTYHQASDTGADVLLMVAEDYTGRSALSTPSRTPARATRAPTPRRSTPRASATTSTTSTRSGRMAPSQLGVLSHYKAVVWETGDDLYVRNGRPSRAAPGRASSSTTR